VEVLWLAGVDPSSHGRADLLRAFYYSLGFMQPAGMANYAALQLLPQVKRVNEQSYRSWMCIICGWVYEEAQGSPEDGLPPGTRWSDVPEDWVCPDCGASKDDFEMIEM
jgi:rubredoxin